MKNRVSLFMDFMKRACCAMFLFLGIANKANSQTFFAATEYGVCFGGSQYFGDLNDEYGLSYIRPVLGAFGKYHLNPYISLKGTVSFTQVGYDDKYNSNVYSKLRNLNFKSEILEVAVQSEFNFFRFSTGENGHRFTPYLTVGVGAFYYNPYTTYGGEKYYLRRIGTEGQMVGYDDRKYGVMSVCFPIGFGFKYWIRPGLNFGIEITDRLTLTDYLDDVSTTYVGAQYFPTDPQNPNPAYVLQDRSVEVTNTPLGVAGKQRGNSASKDQYMYLLLNFSIQLKTYKCPDYLKGSDEYF